VGAAALGPALKEGAVPADDSARDATGTGGGRCPVCRRPLPSARLDRRFCSLACYRRAASVVGVNPTPAEIAERAGRVRAGWSESERLSRLRVDRRPLPWRVPRVVMDAGVLAAVLAGEPGAGPL
jgi:hypothetical protein